MRRLLSYFQRRKWEQRMEEEFAHHLEMLEARFRSEGHDEATAKRLARREFGNSQLLREQHRDARGWLWLEDFGNDIRHAIRQFASTPGFFVVAVATMSLGIGSNTAIFTLVNAAMLRESPYPDPGRLKDITRTFRAQIGWPVHDLRQFVEFRDHTRSFEVVAAMRDKGKMSWVRGDVGRDVNVMRVSAEYFRALGIEPQYGRSFTREEERSSSSPVAIVTEAFLRAELQGRMDQTINLGDRVHSIVGVLPAAFPNQDVQVYLPMEVRPVQDGTNTLVFGRLRDDVTVAQGEQELTNLLQSLVRREYKNQSPELAITLQRFGSSDGREFSGPLVFLSWAVALILLIGCVNLAHLMLARASARAREMAIRASLGAGRFRLARQMLAESILISVLGGAGGLLLANGLLVLLVAASPVDIQAMWEVRMDEMVFAYAFGVSLLTGILFGLVPAWNAGKVDAGEAMKDGGGRGSSGKSGNRLRRILVVAEVALSVVLLAGASVLAMGLLELLALPSGADESRVIAAQMSLRGQRYNTSEKASRFFEEGIARLRAIPNVESAAVTLALPLERGLNCSASIPTAKDRPEQLKFMNWRYTSPNYLEAMRVPLLAGRYLDERDHARGAMVAVVSDAFVKRYLEGQNPIGLSVIEHCGSEIPRTIVGVVADLKTNTLKERVPPTMYIPVSQASDNIVEASHTWFPMNWVIRTRDSGKGIAQEIETVLHGLDPTQPVQKFVTIEDLRSIAVSNERFLAYLVGAFALLALVLTSAGVFGVLSYQVTQRSTEFAIRLALGAHPWRLSCKVFQQGMGLASAGLLLGAVGSAILLRVVLSVFPDLISTTAIRPVVFLIPIAGLAIAVLMSSVAPALRLVRLDPNAALRSS